MEGQKLATLAEAADMKRWAGATLGMNADDNIAERVIALCAGYERLAHGMQDVVAWLSDYDQVPECEGKASMKGAHDLSLALLTQLGATP